MNLLDDIEQLPAFVPMLAKDNSFIIVASCPHRLCLPGVLQGTDPPRKNDRAHDPAYTIVALCQKSTALREELVEFESSIHLFFVIVSLKGV
eukprot:SAG22_NODE_1739_length_3685_cov_157.066072_2_plen_92_part_00